MGQAVTVAGEAVGRACEGVAVGVAVEWRGGLVGERVSVAAMSGEGVEAAAGEGVLAEKREADGVAREVSVSPPPPIAGGVGVL